MRVEPNHSSGRRGHGRWVFWGFLLIAGYFLVTEHQAHVIQFLPFLLLLACPLMHLFHSHGGHGGHGSGTATERKEADVKQAEPQKKHGGCH